MSEAHHKYTEGVIVCPWCAHEHEDVDWRQDGGEGQCEECEQPFRFEAEFTVCWTTKRIEAESGGSADQGGSTTNQEPAERPGDA